MRSRAILDPNTTNTVWVGHVRIRFLGIQCLSIPAGRKRDFGCKAVVAGREAGRESIGEDRVGSSIRVVAAPSYASWVVAFGALVGEASDHVEILWETSDVGPIVAVAVLVIDLCGLLGNTVEAGTVAVPVECWPPVDTLVGLDAGGSAGRGLSVGVFCVGRKGVGTVEGMHMWTLGAGLEGWVEALVAHGWSIAVEEAEVVASTCKGRGCGGQASRESEKVGEHDEVFGKQGMGFVGRISDRLTSMR